MQINLRPYGLNWDLDSSSIPVPDDKEVTQAKYKDRKIEFTLTGQDHSYNIGKLINSGSNGSTYEILDKINGKRAAIKIIKKSTYVNFTPENVKNLVLFEAIIQIVIVTVSKSITIPEINLVGPFAPEMYFIIEDAEHYFLIQERMEHDLISLFNGKFSLDDNTIKIVFTQLSAILKFLYEKLNFNHRDLKLNNIMFTYVARKMNIRLIDFGLSCIENADGLKILPVENVFKYCFKQSRDLSSLLHDFLSDGYIGTYNRKLYEILRKLLYSTTENPKLWKNTYRIYNSNRENPNLTPDVIFNIFKNFNNKSPSAWTSYIVELNTVILNNLDKHEFNNIDNDLLAKFICANPSFVENSETLNNILFVINSNTNEAIDAIVECLKPKCSDSLLLCIEKNYVKAADKFIASCEISDPTFLFKSIAFERYEIFVQLVHKNNSAEFLNAVVNDRTPLFAIYKTVEISEPARVAAKTLLATGKIDLNFKVSHSTILHYLPYSCDYEILQQIINLNSSDEFINKTNMFGETSLDMASKKYIDNEKEELSKFKYITLLLNLPHISLYRPTNNFTALSLLLADMPNSSTNLLFDKILNLDNSKQFIDFKDAALKATIARKNLYALNRLIDLKINIYKSILLDAAESSPEILDKLLPMSNTTAFINCKNTSGETPLIKAAKFKNYHMIDKLLEFPFLKTAHKDGLGKTVLHYMAVQSSLTNSGVNSVVTPELKIIEKLLERNPKLANIRNTYKRGPGNPKYIGERYTRKYIKSKKAPFYWPHKNTNV